ncbi:cytochrome c biogenesis protein DipZ [Sinomonas susongensis]|uniref:cytochrome c biogenesis protein DipZ n=1 Tax=Sinomonas susongensis TaxID=1324851 RepID=UPI0011085080|nr:cytochrome c biogenesis protein DipZ [Sinomonas susongensis]
MSADILIGFLGGLITGISPCILPVLPVIFVSGGLDSARQGAPSSAPTRKTSKWRPYQVIAGLVLSFSAFTLLGSLVLGILGLPQDFFRWAGIGVLAAVGLGLMVPRIEELLEKPFSWIPARRVDSRRGGLGLGLALGAVFVPCAGPVLAAITVSGATGRIGPETIALTLAFAFGVSAPLLFFALAGRRLAERLKSFRRRQRPIRITAGVLMIALAAGLALDLPAAVQRLIPDYTAGLQDRLAPSAGSPLNLGGLVTDENRGLDHCTQNATVLQDCGPAPDFHDVSAWLGTQPLTLAQLRGKVVLIDFWAYSCINCQRSLPHIIQLNDTYRSDGLVVVGVHTPEYAFEREQRNVQSGIAEHGIDYPVAMDNSYGTWTAYRNRFWPAQYLIDANGTVRHVQQGEGGYQTTESLLRQLLGQAHPDLSLPQPVEGKDTAPTPGSTTPETFLGVTKQVNYAGAQPYSPGTATFSYPPAQRPDSFALAGPWKVDTQSITPAGSPGSPAPASRVRLEYHAREVQAVLGGNGTITVRGPEGEKTLNVTGAPRSYVLESTAAEQAGTLEVTASPGLELYSFTFG